ncbi:MAG: helix-turn-helix domain-containing protein [Solirubrobacteraceae bacterium]
MATSSPADRTSPFLTEPEVAAILRVSGRTVRTWADRGILRAVRIGGVRRYSAQCVAELVEQSNDDEPAGNRLVEKERDRDAHHAA